MITARLSLPQVLQVQTGFSPTSKRSITDPTRIPAIALGVLLAGYMLGDRGFAYLHLPGTPLFVGEVVLAIIAVYLIRFYPINDDRLKSPVRLALVVFLVYSALRTLPYLGQYGIDALRDASQWYYGIFAFFVADFVRRRGIGPIVALVRQDSPLVHPVGTHLLDPEPGSHIAAGARFGCADRCSPRVEHLRLAHGVPRFHVDARRTGHRVSPGVRERS